MIARNLLFALFGILVLAVLFLWFRPQAPDTTTAAPAAPAAAAVTPGPAVPLSTLLAWHLENGRLLSGPQTAQVHQGQTVTLQVLSDRADELHLHGYDLQLKLVAGQSGSLSFLAEHSGRFELELHDSHRELGVLEVLPR